MKNRQPGFYRVRRSPRIGVSRWVISEWTGLYWLETGEDTPAYDHHYSDIDETPVEMPKS